MKQQRGRACARVTSWIGAYVDGELNNRQAAAVQRHLRICPSCQAAEQELRTLLQLVSEADACPVEPSVTLRASVMRVVAGSPRQQQKPLTSPMWRRASGVLAGLCCIVVLGAALWVGQGLHEKVSFDAVASAPEASDPKGEQPDAESFPMPEDQPNDQDGPMEPTEPCDPDKSAESCDTYRLTRVSGGASGAQDGWELLDGEWQGEHVTLSITVQAMSASICFEGGEMQSARLEGTDEQRYLVLETGERLQVIVPAEEHTIWLIPIA